MQSISRSVFLLIGLLCCASVFAQDRGETLFNQTCVACHTIGGGKLIGPDLAHVHTQREEAWLIRFVQASQEMIAENDPDAVALFEEYGGLVMPPHAFSDDDVRAIIGYIARRSPPGGAPDPDAPVATTGPLTPEDIQRGRDLFVGLARFENGGAPCNACHHVNTDAVMTGGALAVDLTDAVSRLTRPGVEAMMSNPPFPAMRKAFEERALTAEEVAYVAAFLQSADAEQATQSSRNYGNTLFLYGLIGVVVLLGFFALLGIRSTKKTVNSRIYERQIKSI